MRLIGGAKLLLAATLVVGIWVPLIVRPAAIAMAARMLGAVAMRVRIGGPPVRALPAFVMLALAAFVATCV